MRILLTLASLLFALPATAQDWPDLLGTWTGTSRTVVTGAGGHFSGADATEAQFHEVELTIEWTEQNAGRYVGSITSAAHTERKLGVASSDGTSLYTVDHDGHSAGRIIDADHFELCYMQTSIADPQMVASCVEFGRQK